MPNDDRGTLFPGLYDDTPGDDQAVQAQDITDVQLPKLSDDYPESEVAHPVGHVSHVPNMPLPAGAQQPQGQEDVAGISQYETTPQQQPHKKRRSIRDRISQLTRQRDLERDGRTQAEAQLDRLTDAMIKQQEQINQLIASGRNPYAPAPAPGEENLGLPHADRQPNQHYPAAQPNLTAEQIRDIVSGAINDYDQQWRNRAALQSRLQTAQEESYLDAQDEFPELADVNAPITKAFREIWSRLPADHPLRISPDGPYHVAMQARGLVADEVSYTQDLTQRKRQAAVMPMAPTATDVVPEGAVQTKAMAARYAQLSKQLRAGNATPDLMFEYRKLGRALGRTRAR